MDLVGVATVVGACAAVAGVAVTLFHHELTSMFRRTTTSVGGVWVGEGKDVEGFGTRPDFSQAVYRRVVLTLRQTGRRVTGTGSVTTSSDEKLSASLRGEVVADDRVCILFTSAPPSRDYGVAVLSLDASGQRLTGQILGREMAGSGLVRFEIVLDRERDSSTA